MEQMSTFQVKMLFFVLVLTEHLSTFNSQDLIVNSPI